MAGLLTHLNTRLKLFEKVSLLLVVLVLVASVNIGVIYVYHQQAEQVGNSVNIAGQERMLSQRMARLANDVQQGDDRSSARDRLRIASDRFAKNLEALENGGSVPDRSLNPAADTTPERPQVILRGEDLAPAPDSLKPELKNLRQSWDAYEPHVMTIITAEAGSEEFQEAVRYVNEHSDTLLSQSDTVTAEFTVVLRERRSLLVQVLFVLLAVDISIALIGAFAARRYIGLPMADIARTGTRLASGETSPLEERELPIDSTIPKSQQRSELAQLSSSFHDVQNYHKTASQQAQALAERDFDDPILRERIPGELGESLAKMQTDLPSYIEELRTTKEKLEALVRASPAGIMITGTDGQVKRWNPAAEDIFGWNGDEVLGQMNPAVPESDHEDFRDLLSSAIVGGAISGEERQWQTKGGDTVDVSLSVAPVPGGQETLEGVMVVLEDITERKERERTLEQQRDDLETLNQVSDLVLKITQELVQSSNQDRIESTVCRSLYDSDLYESAWIVGRESNGSYSVRSAPEQESVQVDDRIDATNTVYDAIARTFEEATVSLESEIRGPIFEEAPLQEAPNGAAVIPLAYREAVFGALVVTTNRKLSFSDREVAGLSTLGNTVGFAIDALTDKKLLFADIAVELTFDVSQTAFPFVKTSAVCDCQIFLDGIVGGTEAETVDVYLGVADASIEKLVETLETEPTIQRVSVIEKGSEPYRVKVSLGNDSIFHKIARREGRMQAIDLKGGEGTYTLEVPRNADVETTVDLITSADEMATFVAKTEAERETVLGTRIEGSFKEDLTDRQYEVIKTAYLAGYFEWPRQTTIEEVAEDLGVSGSTVNHHLRHAQLKVVKRIFDSESSD